MKYPIEPLHVAHMALSNTVTATRECWDTHDKGTCYKTPTSDITERDVGLTDRVIGHHKHRSVSRHTLYIIELTSKEVYDNDLVYPVISSEYTNVTEEDNGDTFIISTTIQAVLEMEISEELMYILVPEDYHHLLKTCLEKENN